MAFLVELFDVQNGGLVDLLAEELLGLGLVLLVVQGLEVLEAAAAVSRLQAGAAACLGYAVATATRAQRAAATACMAALTAARSAHVTHKMRRCCVAPSRAPDGSGTAATQFHASSLSLERGTGARRAAGAPLETLKKPQRGAVWPAAKNLPKALPAHAPCYAPGNALPSVHWHTDHM